MHQDIGTEFFYIPRRECLRCSIEHAEVLCTNLSNQGLLGVAIMSQLGRAQKKQSGDRILEQPRTYMRRSRGRKVSTCTITPRNESLEELFDSFTGLMREGSFAQQLMICRDSYERSKHKYKDSRKISFLLPFFPPRKITVRFLSALE